MPKMCFFTWDHRTSLFLYSSHKATFFVVKLLHLLSAKVQFVQSLPLENCTGSEGTVTEVGCTKVKHTSSRVKNVKQCPQAVLVVRDFIVPSTPSTSPRSWLSYLCPAVAAPLAWAAWSDTQGFLSMLRKLKQKHFQNSTVE